MSLEIHYDQIQNAIDTFNTGHTSFEQAHSSPVTHAENTSDALNDAHQAALGELDRLLGSAVTNFSQMGLSAQAVFDGFKTADAAGS